jgi:CRP/FNR family transcriptional regulator, nitrogen oxide reductase regulator
MAAPAVIRFRKTEPRFLDGLSAAEVKMIVSAARQRQYLANSVIVNQGHPAEHFFLLVSGRARYFYLTRDGRKVILRWITPGEIFAPAALVSPSSEYLVSTEAVKNSSVLVWDRSVIRNLITRYPRLIDNTFLIMFQYFLFYRDAHMSRVYDTAPQRVAHVLTHLTSSIGKRVAGGIEIDVWNEELANEANVTPFTVSRLLSSWQLKGILTKRRGKVLLRSPERLFLESNS